MIDITAGKTRVDDIPIKRVFATAATRDAVTMFDDRFVCIKAQITKIASKIICEVPSSATVRFDCR